MRFLAQTIVQAAIDNKEKAFDSQGIKRLLIPLYGQKAFLAGLKDSQKPIANDIFYRTLAKPST